MKNLYLLTDLFPYGNGETTFVMPEIEALRKEYNIIIISSAGKDVAKQKELTAHLDENIKVLRFCADEENKVLYYVYLLSFWMKKACWNEAHEIIKTHKKVFIRIWKSMHFYARAESLYHWMRKNHVIAQDDGIYYSYWYHDRALALAMHRDKYPNLKIITRAHGYDLYAERKKYTWQPFKKVMDDKLDKIFLISQHGYQYCLQKYASSENLNKYKVNRLGVQACNAALYDTRKEELLLVSCSSLITLKRVHLIIEALTQISEYQIRWTHFGTGELYEELHTMAQEKLGLKKNIKYCFEGYRNNEEIIDFYQTEKPDCFITTSSTEGSPVSIQEALAVGMPVIGTNVGGIPEMIDGNGFLLDENPRIESISKAICEICTMDSKSYGAMRRRSYQIWQNDYNRKENIERFMTELSEL